MPPPYSDPPPPYTERPLRPLPSSSRSSQHPNPGSSQTGLRDNTFISFFIPIGSNLIGGVTSRKVVRLPSNIPFGDGFTRICANMDVDPLTASLGYKLSGDAVKTAPSRIMSSDDWEHMLQIAREKIRNARTKVVTVDIHNLAPPQQAPAATGENPLKRPAEDRSITNTGSVLTHKAILKDKYACREHPGSICYARSGSAAPHVRLDDIMLQLWARALADGRNGVTIDDPPQLAVFDPRNKRARIVSTPKASTASIDINIHNHTQQSAAGPLTDHGGQRLINRSSNDPDHLVDDGTVRYPSIRELLALLDEVRPELNYPQYGDSLVNNGVAYVNVVSTLDMAFFTDIVHMPRLIVEPFVARAAKLARTAQKGKGRDDSVVEGQEN